MYILMNIEVVFWVKNWNVWVMVGLIWVIFLDVLEVLKSVDVMIFMVNLLKFV